MLIDDLMETSDVYFYQTKEKMTFFYPGLGLCLMDMLKDVCEGRLMDDTYDLPLVEPIVPPVKDA